MPQGRGRLGSASSLSGIVTRYRLQRGVWETDRPSPLDCTAGRTSIVVEHDGAVRACELRGVVANLRDFDMDFRALQASPALAAEVDAVLRRNAAARIRAPSTTACAGVPAVCSGSFPAPM